MSPKSEEMLEHEYARSALKLGLALEDQLGTNPFKFGMIGATDSHTSLTAVEEDKLLRETLRQRTRAPSVSGMCFLGSPDGSHTVLGWEQVASGYQGVWATENTREALFDAMKRKETYATTGPRMMVRFFGGWDFEPEDANTRQPAEAGYTKGIPMGGDLTNAPADGAPSFLVGALKDPFGAKPGSNPDHQGVGSMMTVTPRSESTMSSGRTSGNPYRTGACQL